jgi:hypothetical protein
MRSSRSWQSCGVSTVPPLKGSTRASPRRATTRTTKCPGKPDAVHGDAGPPPHRDVDRGEGDRDPGAAVEHVVEEAVARIVVLARVPAEAFLLEEDAVEAGHRRFREAPRRPRTASAIVSRRCR